ncbi:MAG: hybrid sensor histidine kinase/response regulator transcription factor [Bacteroidota bacterium]
MIKSILRFAGGLFCQLLFFLPSHGFSQAYQGEVSIQNISSPEGYQLPYVYDLAQDSCGLLWLYSEGDCNLYTYDGHRLSKVDSSMIWLDANNCSKLYSNNSGSRFYLTNKRVTVFDPNSRRIKQILHWEEEEKITSPVLIRHVGIASDSIIWGIAILQNGSSKAYVIRSNQNDPFKTVSPIELNWYYDEVLVHKNLLYVKLRDRIEVYAENGLYKTYNFPSGPDPVMPSIVKDEQNTLWVVYSPDKSADKYVIYYLEEGMSTFKPTTIPFPQRGKFSQLFDDGQYIWHRSYPFSLSRLNVKTGMLEDFTSQILLQKNQFPFYNSHLLNICMDQSGERWLTTRAGVVKMTLEEGVFERLEIDPNCRNLTCQIKGITEDELGNIYFSSNNGIFKRDPITRKVEPLPIQIPVQAQKKHGLTYAKGYLFWNEYAIQLNTYEVRKVIKSSNYDYISHGLSPDSNTLWLAVNDFPFQIHRYTISKQTVRQLQLPDTVLNRLNAEIRTIHHSPTTNSLFLSVWLEGLLELDTTGQVLKEYNHGKNPESWISNAMYTHYEDENGQLWVAHGQEAGLSKLDLETRSIVKYPYEITSFTGPLKRVFQILPGNEDKLWLVSEKGVLQFDTQKGRLSRFPMFPTLSKMAYHLLPAFSSGDRKLFIGTPNGDLNLFDPEQLLDQAGLDRSYPIVINRLERYNEKKQLKQEIFQDLDDLQEIHLGHQDRYIVMDFFSPDFRNTSQNLYRYWLEGYDRDWTIPARISQLRYENLPPKTYTLHIQGGLMPEFYPMSERQLKIVVHRAWYNTIWAYLLYSIIILGSFYLFFRYQINLQVKRSEANRLQELNALKSKLYTNITHEFRTPLTIIMGVASTIRGHQQEKELIHRNSENLLRLINQLLDLSKLDAGLLPIKWVQGNIVSYLHYLCESFFSVAKEKRIRLNFYPEIKELIIDYDEEKIQHIIYNLLSNAIKYTSEEGSVILHLNKIVQQDKEWLQLKVSDTGPGIPASSLPYIFDRFFQTEDKQLAVDGGTGIGLALTKELVELLGGKIAVQSKLGEGSDFMVLLPIHKKPGITKIEAKQTDKRLSGVDKEQVIDQWIPASLDREKPLLLLIEDNKDVRKFISGLLNTRCKIEVAQNGQIGIDRAIELIPDIIISDVMMPEKNGYEVCQILKNDERTSHIPIILLTARATQVDRVEGLKEGADAYLVKPFHQEELFIRISQLLLLRKNLQQRYSKFQISQAENGNQSLDERFLQKLIEVVEARIDDPDLGVVHLCRAVNRSNAQVNRKLKGLTGKTPSQFIRTIRLQQALKLLESSDLNISEIAYQVGFSNPNYFTRSFKEEFGYPPNVVRK